MNHRRLLTGPGPRSGFDAGALSGHSYERKVRKWRGAGGSLESAPTGATPRVLASWVEQLGRQGCGAEIASRSCSSVPRRSRGRCAARGWRGCVRSTARITAAYLQGARPADKAMATPSRRRASLGEIRVSFRGESRESSIES